MSDWDLGQIVDDQVGSVLSLVPRVIQWSVQGLRAGYNGHDGESSLKMFIFINTCDDLILE